MEKDGENMLHKAIRKAAHNALNKAKELCSRPITKCALNLAAIGGLAIVIGSMANTGGTLQRPVKIPLSHEGREIGSMTLPIGSEVLILETQNKKNLIQGHSGEPIWVEESSVITTGKIPDFVARQEMEAKKEALRSARTSSWNPHPRFRPPTVPDLPTGKENIPSTWPEAEKQVLKLTNMARKAHRLPPLKWDENLARAARFHAAHMANHGYLDHDTWGKSGRLECFDRIKRFTPKGGAENIARGQRTPKDVVESWMKSPGHRANILGKETKTLGVGVCGTYWVQNFGR
jgi:uncharacterized protein YkwD